MFKFNDIEALVKALGRREMSLLPDGVLWFVVNTRTGDAVGLGLTAFDAAYDAGAIWPCMWCEIPGPS